MLEPSQYLNPDQMNQEHGSSQIGNRASLEK